MTMSRFVTVKGYNSSDCSDCSDCSDVSYDGDTVDHIRDEWSAVFGHAMAEFALLRWALERNDNSPQAPPPHPKNNERTYVGMAAGQQTSPPATPGNFGDNTAEGVDGQRPVKESRTKHDDRDTKPPHVPGCGPPPPGYRAEGVCPRQTHPSSLPQSWQAPLHPTTPSTSTSVTGGTMAHQYPWPYSSQPYSSQQGSIEHVYSPQPPPPGVNQPPMGYQGQPVHGAQSVSNTALQYGSYNNPNLGPQWVGQPSGPPPGTNQPPMGSQTHYGRNQFNQPQTPCARTSNTQSIEEWAARASSTARPYIEAPPSNPPDQPLTDEQQRQIDRWVAQQLSDPWEPEAKNVPSKSGIPRGLWIW